MSKIKYSNGLYKSTSHSQDEISGKLFCGLSNSCYFLTMSTQFLQYSGNCTYSYYQNIVKNVLTITLNRQGKII